jgi:DASS family divalent anion:Na+ symporter
MNRAAILRLLPCVVIGALGWIVPPPAALTLDAWHLLFVFTATIASFVLRPLAMGPMVLVGVVALASTGAVGFKELLHGFGDKTVWLVVAAFLLAGTVQRTGVGRRVALWLVTRFGSSMLGLGYAQCAAELLLGPVVPSNGARGGGLLAPIADALARSLGSEPNAATRERAGAYLALVGAHANSITAAMFMTGMAANPLVSAAAKEIFGVEFGWGTWALGAIVPGLIGLALLPLFLRWVSPPELTRTAEAQRTAREQLSVMGPLSREERITAIVFAVLLALWSTQPLHGLGTALVAWIGVLALQLCGVDRWPDVTGNDKAWDCLVWLGGLLAMANALKAAGVITWFADTMQAQVAGYSGLVVIIVLALVYFFSMYGFSMLTAHISALASAFFAIALAAGAPALLSVALIAYFSTLCACTTTYSTGPIIVYFGLRYVDPGKWFRVGLQVAGFHLAVWFGAGMPWWKLLGWW